MDVILGRNANLTNTFQNNLCFSLEQPNNYLCCVSMGSKKHGKMMYFFLKDVAVV